MNAEHLLQHFDRLSEAPDAIPRLRRFILDLAVRGKLVEQYPNDEPAAELLKRIEAEKARLVKEGRLRPEKQLPKLDTNLTDFNAPLNWEWVRLGQIIKLWNGYAFKSGDFQTTGIPVIRIGDLQNGLVNIDSAAHVPTTVADKVAPEIWIPPDALLIAMSGATTGKVAFNRSGLRLLLNQRVGRIEVFNLDINFLKFFFETIIARNLSISFGTAIPNLSAQQINETAFPLPPLAEQHRIVAKVNELMALCDQLEAAKAEREQSRDRLLAANLNHLNQPADDEEAFHEHVRFTFNHLPRITTRPAHIKQLRQTILNLAVRGKLVPQNPSDEPAVSIADSTSSLDGKRTTKIEKIKQTDCQITIEETPFQVPVNWSWARVGDICNLISGKGFKADEYVDSGMRLFQIANVSFGVTKWETLNFLPLSYCETYPDLVLSAGDLLIALNRPLLNRQIKSAILSKTDLPAILYQRVGKFIFYSTNILPEYFFRYLQSLLFIEQLEEKMQGSDQPFINKTQMIQFLVPLPPLPEQHRIVAKVDELMTLCDQLETQLNTTETDSHRLLEAVLHEALIPARDKVA